MNDPRLLALDNNQLEKIVQTVHDNRLDWELWLESATSFSELKNKLRHRGYHGFPMTEQPEFFPRGIGITQEIIDRLPNQRSMIRKRSQSR